MNRVKELRRAMGDSYSFQKFITDREVSRLRRQAPQHMEDTIAASLTVGCMKINAVLFQEDSSLRLGYDVYVKDSPGSSRATAFNFLSEHGKIEEWK